MRCLRASAPRNHAAVLRLVELFPDWSDERFPFYAVYPSRLHRAAKVRAFIEFCLEIMGGNKNAVPRKAQ